MRRVSYLKRATRRFLEGTRFKTPVEAVEAGARTLADWALVLAEEREVEAEYLRERAGNRKLARAVRAAARSAARGAQIRMDV